jgi:hypothetical protein
MNISTKGETVREKVANLREKHQPYFEEKGIPGAVFFPKMAYRPRGKDELYVGFFATEFKRECDVYTEFVSNEYYPEDVNRTLWVWKYNPHWEEEYETTEPNTLGHVRYLVPVSELLKVNTAQQETKKVSADSFDSFGLGLVEDAPISDMTIRDFATIMTGKPFSTKSWLNKLITEK